MMNIDARMYPASAAYQDKINNYVAWRKKYNEQFMEDQDRITALEARPGAIDKGFWVVLSGSDVRGDGSGERVQCYPEPIGPPTAE